MKIPSTQEQIDQNISNFESRLNQNTPQNDKSFNRVLSTIEGIAFTTLYKYAKDRFAAALAITAKGSDLDTIGAQYSILRKAATSESITLSASGLDGTVIPSGTILVGTSNAAIFESTQAVTISSGSATIPALAKEPGTPSNLQSGDSMEFQSQIPGITASLSVDSVIEYGTDTESDQAYRSRLLVRIRSFGGGCSSSDYARWALSVSGVVAAFPYSGLPFVRIANAANIFATQFIKIVGSPTGGSFTLSFNGSTTSSLNYNCTASDIQSALRALSGADSVIVSVLDSGFIVTDFGVWSPVTLALNALTGGTNAYISIQPNEPPARTVYIECDSSIDPDGVPSQSILDSVTEAITYGSDGKTQQSLGLSNDSLFVMPISRTKFFVQISSLSVPSGSLSGCQDAIQSALESYFLSLAPFVDGYTPDFDRNDLITNPSVGRIVQSILIGFGASCGSVAFGSVSGVWVASYQLALGEKAALHSGGVSYV